MIPCLPLVKATKRKRGQIHGEDGNTNVPWFHQEYLPLVAKEDFRVFLIPKSNLEGVIFLWVHTAVNRLGSQRSRCCYQTIGKRQRRVYGKKYN